jgi:hypothetical protein
VYLQASLSADAAAQEPLAQPLDVHHHAFVGFLHFRHGMSFQMQLFSDKGLYEHLGSRPFVFFGRNNEFNPMPGCRSNADRPQPQAFKDLQLSLHFSERNRIIHGRSWEHWHQFSCYFSATIPVSPKAAARPLSIIRSYLSPLISST